MTAISYLHLLSLQNTDITLPEDFVCEDCTLQLLRNAAEWGTSTGQPYLFWSCADISIVNSELHVVVLINPLFVALELSSN